MTRYLLPLLSNEEADLNKSWYNELQGASKEAILDESRDVLCDLKALINQLFLFFYKQLILLTHQLMWM